MQYIDCNKESKCHLEMFRITVDSFGTTQRQILKINVLLNQRPVCLLHHTNCDFNVMDPSNTVSKNFDIFYRSVVVGVV